MARADSSNTTMITAVVYNDLAWRVAQMCRKRGLSRPKLIETLLIEAADAAGIAAKPGAR